MFNLILLCLGLQMISTPTPGQVPLEPAKPLESVYPFPIALIPPMENTQDSGTTGRLVDLNVPVEINRILVEQIGQYPSTNVIFPTAPTVYGSPQ